MPKSIFSHIDASELKGCYMLLDEASVTGTANIVMAAVLAKGTTTIYYAACEPYLQQLCLMLNRMGAKISWHRLQPVTIEGVKTWWYGTYASSGYDRDRQFHRLSCHDAI